MPRQGFRFALVAGVALPLLMTAAANAQTKGLLGEFRFGTVAIPAPAFSRDDGEILGTLSGGAGVVDIPANNMNWPYPGRSADLTFALEGGDLPPGASLSPDGELRIEPFATTGATYTFAVRATNSLGISSVRTFSLASSPAPAVSASSVIPSSVTFNATEYKANLAYAGQNPRLILFDGSTASSLEYKISSNIWFNYKYAEPVSLDRLFIHATAVVTIEALIDGQYVEIGKTGAGPNGVLMLDRSYVTTDLRFKVIGRVYEIRPGDGPAATQPAYAGGPSVIGQTNNEIISTAAFSNNSPYSESLSFTWTGEKTIGRTKFSSDGKSIKLISALLDGDVTLNVDVVDEFGSAASTSLLVKRNQAGLAAAENRTPYLLSSSGVQPVPSSMNPVDILFDYSAATRIDLNKGSSVRLVYSSPVAIGRLDLYATENAEIQVNDAGVPGGYRTIAQTYKPQNGVLEFGSPVAATEIKLISRSTRSGSTPPLYLHTMRPAGPAQ